MPWHYKTLVLRGLGVRDLAERRREGDAEGGKGERGAGARGGAQEEALAVLFDLGLGERVEVGHHRRPGGASAGARRVEAVLQLLLQNEREKAAGPTWPRIVSSSW